MKPAKFLSRFSVARLFPPAGAPGRPASDIVLPLLAGTVLLLAAMPAISADIAAGEKLANERCAACHGKDGNTPIDPSYPRLSGQHEDYLVQALRAYKQDQRKNPIMGAQAKPLSREEILNLAAYYARLPGMMSHAR